MDEDGIKIVLFDLFGTLFDWKGTIVDELSRVTGKRDKTLYEKIADDWADGYSIGVKSMQEWTNLDVVLATSFGRIAPRYGLDALKDEDYYHIATTWSRLKPWPDVPMGLQRLRREFKVETLTNANTRMITSLAVNAPLIFDDYNSAEDVMAYKPHPSVYKYVINKYMFLCPDQFLMVAAHCFDLNAAKKQGMKTALITRQGEFGSDPSGLKHEADFIVENLEQLADKLGA